jgi:hypothetical protein
MRIIFVSVLGDDITGNGSDLYPYATIEKALSVFTDGDQIRLLEGTYTPTDSIVISGLSGSIFAEAPHIALIKPRQTLAYPACVVILDSPRFSLTGLNIEQATDVNTNQIGIYARNVNHLVCFTCSVHDFTSPSGDVCGIYASGNGRIQDCSVYSLNNVASYLSGICTSDNIDVIDCEVHNLSGAGFGELVYPVDPNGFGVLHL